MKEFVRRVKSFITFDFPLQPAYIKEAFTSMHAHYKEQFPNWDLEATRKKVISHFWFRGVLFHYSFILAFSTLLAMPILSTSSSLLIPVFIAGCITLVTLTFFYYWPAFYSDFLPKLDTIMGEQQRRLRSLEEIKKCKRTQYSTTTLIIIFYVFSKVGNIPLLPSNDPSAELLNKLYGVDKDKLKQNLSRLYKLSRLSPKERAEIFKGIDTARDFFEVLDCKASLSVLDELEVKTNRGPS